MDPHQGAAWRHIGQGQEVNVCGSHTAGVPDAVAAVCVWQVLAACNRGETARRKQGDKGASGSRGRGAVQQWRMHRQACKTGVVGLHHCCMKGGCGCMLCQPSPRPQHLPRCILIQGHTPPAPFPLAGSTGVIMCSSSQCSSAAAAACQGARPAVAARYSAFWLVKGGSRWRLHGFPGAVAKRQSSTIQCHGHWTHNKSIALNSVPVQQATPTRCGWLPTFDPDSCIVWHNCAALHTPLACQLHPLVHPHQHSCMDRP
jgi:hypothetical protein